MGELVESREHNSFTQLFTPLFTPPLAPSRHQGGEPVTPPFAPRRPPPLGAGKLGGGAEYATRNLVYFQFRASLY